MKSNSDIKLPVLSQNGGLEAYLSEIRKFPMLEANEEIDLARRWRDDGDVKAAHRLVTSHLRLVAKIAMGYRGYGMPVSDLIAEGNLGMMQAVKGFDPEKGFRLSTYAMWWIRAAIQEYILKSWSLVKIASSAVQKKLFFKLNQAKNAIKSIEHQMSGEERTQAIANYLDVGEKDVSYMEQRLSGGDLSLNAPLKSDSSDEWIDWLEDSTPSHEHRTAEKNELTYQSKLLASALHELDDREKDIILQRKLSEKPATLDALSKAYNVSRERIRQIEIKAFNKLQKHVLQDSLT